MVTRVLPVSEICNVHDVQMKCRTVISARNYYNSVLLRCYLILISNLLLKNLNKMQHVEHIPLIIQSTSHIHHRLYH